MLVVEGGDVAVEELMVNRVTARIQDAARCDFVIEFLLCHLESWMSINANPTRGATTSTGGWMDFRRLSGLQTAFR
jgi:hypothetical protein